MTTLNTTSLPIEQKSFYVPSLDDIREVLATGLTSNFSTVQVDVIDCPNLQVAPYHLAGKGLSGSTKLIDIGGPPYLLPLVDRSRLYDLKEICQKISPSNTELLAIGAGAGPHPYAITNCEGIYNLKISSDGRTDGSNSHLVKVNQLSGNEEFIMEKIPHDETRLPLLGNIFLSEGKPGPVLRIQCKNRIGSDNFISNIRKTLQSHYKDKTIGLGGVFLLKTGKVKQHVMRDFSTIPIKTETDLNNWLKFYEMSAPLIALGTLMTNDMDLDVRVEHFHSFSMHGSGGHYHYDTTPATVEYEAIFNLADSIVRVDKPLQTHQLGRD